MSQDLLQDHRSRPWGHSFGVISECGAGVYPFAAGRRPYASAASRFKHLHRDDSAILTDPYACIG